MILRESWNDSFFLVTNAQGERLRFRHLHMHPRRLDDDGIFSGRVVKEGDRLGTIGNYNRRPGMTTTHLHFEIQVPTRDGYVRINPYTTLIASYEHLIGARGSEISEPVLLADADEKAADSIRPGNVGQDRNPRSQGVIVPGRAARASPALRDCIVASGVKAHLVASATAFSPIAAKVAFDRIAADDDARIRRSNRRRLLHRRVGDCGFARSASRTCWRRERRSRSSNGSRHSGRRPLRVEFPARPTIAS